MSDARFLVGDVFEQLATIPDGSVDLVLTSPPFLALRSYLPPDHPDKAKEIGSESSPAAFLGVMLRLTAEWRRVLAPHGSIAIELGDVFAGSGGAGGDYRPGGWREGQPEFDGSAYKYRRRPDPTGNGWGPMADRFTGAPGPGGQGWPLPKSLCMVPTLYPACLAYGWNLLDPSAGPSPAGMWRVRTLKPWIRSNPPVGDLGDKERPATSYVTVATLARDRYFDLDAVRAPLVNAGLAFSREGHRYDSKSRKHTLGDYNASQSAGAPPLDWWHHVDGVLDAALAAYAKGTTKPRTANGAGKRANSGKSAAAERGGNWATLDTAEDPPGDGKGVRGYHLRRALERAGIVRTLDAVEVSSGHYPGSHYAVWPPELVRLLVEEMAPRHVCTTCGEPRRRIAETVNAVGRATARTAHLNGATGKARTDAIDVNEAPDNALRRTTGWTDCGHGTWRPGRVLDPFAGSGTTLAVCSGLGRESIGIDIDERNADLARERVGMFLDITYREEPV